RGARPRTCRGRRARRRLYGRRPRVGPLPARRAACGQACHEPRAATRHAGRDAPPSRGSNRRGARANPGRGAARASGRRAPSDPCSGTRRRAERLRMKAAVALAIAVAATQAGAHPLGNFTTNRQARLTIAPDSLAVHYVVDLAELPTYRAVQAMDANGDGQADVGERAAWVAGLATDVERTLRVTVDGAAAALRRPPPEANILP